MRSWMCLDYFSEHGSVANRKASYLIAPAVPCATLRRSRQVAAHQNGVQLFPAGLLVIALAASGDRKSGSLVKPPRRLIVFLDFEEYGAHASAGQMAKMRQQAGCGTGRVRDDWPRPRWKVFRPHPPPIRDTAKPMILPSNSEPMHQRIALGQHGFEFAFAPAAVKRLRRAVAPAGPRRAGSRIRPQRFRRSNSCESQAIMTRKAAALSAAECL